MCVCVCVCVCMCVYIYIYITFCIYSLVCGHLGCFLVLATVTNAAMNMEVHISFQISIIFSFGYIPRSGIAGSHGRSIFNFLRNFYNVFYSGCTNLHFSQWCTSVTISPYPQEHFLFLVFFIIAIQTSVRCYLTALLSSSFIAIYLTYSTV